MNTLEIRAAVKAELEQAQIPFSARYVGETTREKWQCDAWRVKLGDFETDYFTGLGHRKAPSFPKPFPPYKPGTLAHEAYVKTFKPQTPAAADVLHSLSRIPLEHAPRIWRLVQACREVGRPYARPEQRSFSEHAGAYAIDGISADGDLKVGCHSIPYTEIERMARTLGFEVQS
jgi:hypothetical protein